MYTPFRHVHLYTKKHSHKTEAAFNAEIDIVKLIIPVIEHPNTFLLVNDIYDIVSHQYVEYAEEEMVPLFSAGHYLLFNRN